MQCRRIITDRLYTEEKVHLTNKIIH